MSKGNGKVQRTNPKIEHLSILESALMNSVLISPDMIGECLFLSPADFYFLSHQHIWQAILDLYGAGDSVDNLTLTDQLRSNGQLEEVGGVARIIELCLDLPGTSFVNVATYARQVKQHSKRRKLGLLGQRLFDVSEDWTVDTEEVLRHAERLVSETVQESSEHEIIDQRSAVESTYIRVEDMVNGGEKPHILSCGLKGLDKLLGGGMGKGRRYTVAGEDKSGKSSALRTFALHLAQQGQRVFWWSGEMMVDDLITFQLLTEKDVTFDLLRYGKLVDDRQFSRFAEACQNKAALPIWYNDVPGLTSMQLQAQVEKTISIAG
ncbi:hypothetical protein GF380_04245, partial [Candidatus Uhrbacteria bacterium]|nr:hypothetical protein [Candidatus Uhrbacteria bacterium]